MNMWEIREDYDDYGRDFGMREGGEYEQGFKDGCRHGYEKAMREMQQDHMAMRGAAGYGGGMNERRYTPPYYPEHPMGARGDGYDMGERRRRDAYGRYM